MSLSRFLQDVVELKGDARARGFFQFQDISQAIILISFKLNHQGPDLHLAGHRVSEDMEA